MRKLFTIALAALLFAGCDPEYVPQPPTAKIENVSGKTSIAFGESITLKAGPTGDLPATIAWTVGAASGSRATMPSPGGTPTITGTGETFEFKGDVAGARVIMLTVTNADGTATDRITITVGEPQPPVAHIIEPDREFEIVHGEKYTLFSQIDSPLPTTLQWAVDGADIAGATGTSFDFSSTVTGDHKVSVTVTNAGGKVTSEVTVTVFDLIDFEDVPAESLAGPTSYGENLYSAYEGTQYTGYTDTDSHLSWGINVGADNKHEFWNGGVVNSQWNDMTTAGYGNQCSVFYKDAESGFGGAGGSKTFAVNNNSGSMSFTDADTEAQFGYVWVTNGTYAALSMRDGDAYAKKFGLGDWFKLTISATDKAGAATGTPVEFYLADFRTATSPGIVTEWTQVDLTSLGDKVHKISFALSSSDVGDWGMNTPAYFCLDNLAFLKQ